MANFSQFHLAPAFTIWLKCWLNISEPWLALRNLISSQHFGLFLFKQQPYSTNAFSVQTVFLFKPIFKQHSYSNLFPFKYDYSCIFCSNNFLVYAFSVQTTCIFSSNNILIHAFSVQSAYLFMQFQFKQHFYFCLFCSNSILIHAFSVQSAYLFMQFQFKQHFYFCIFSSNNILIRVPNYNASLKLRKT